MNYNQLLATFFRTEIKDGGFPAEDQAILMTFKRRFSDECIDSMRFQYSVYQTIAKKAGLGDLTERIKAFHVSHNEPIPKTPIEWLASACLFMLSREAETLINKSEVETRAICFDFDDPPVDEFGIIEKHHSYEVETVLGDEHDVF